MWRGRRFFCDCAAHKIARRALKLQRRRRRKKVTQWRRRTGRSRRRGETNLDLPHICRTFDGARVEQALPPEPRQGPDRPLDRLRPADPDRIRQRPRPRPRRGRKGRRRDLPHRRHARAVRGDSDRLDEHLDDHQRHRAVAAGSLYRRRGRARGAAHPASRHDPERHHQGISGARLLCVPARPVAQTDQGHDPVLRPRGAEMESDERLLLPSAGGGRDPGPGTLLRARHRHRRARARPAGGRGRREGFRQRGRKHLVLRQRRHALHYRTRQDARLRRVVG